MKPTISKITPVNEARIVEALVDATAGEPAIHCLTGTPMTNRPRDLFPTAADREASDGRSFMAFAKKYRDAYSNRFGLVTDGASNLMSFLPSCMVSCFAERKTMF